MDDNLLGQLTIFVAAAQTNSFRAAAKQLERQPSAITAAVKRLEHDVMNGRPLFVRRATGTHLTTHGEELLPLAVDLLSSAKAFRDQASDVSETPSTVRIGTIQGAWYPLIRQAESNLDADFKIETVALDPYWPAQGLVSGEVDWALLPAPSEHDPKLTRTPLFTEQRTVSVATAGSLGARGKATLAEIDNETWIGAPPGADRVFTAAHRCDDIREPIGPPPSIGRYVLNPLDIGHAIRSGELIVGSMHSVTNLFTGIIDGVCDVAIADAPPWQIDLVGLRSHRGSRPFDPLTFASALIEAAAASETPGLESL